MGLCRHACACLNRMEHCNSHAVRAYTGQTLLHGGHNSPFVTMDTALSNPQHRAGFGRKGQQTGADSGMPVQSAISACNEMGRPVAITRVVDTMVSAPRCTRYALEQVLMNFPVPVEEHRKFVKG